ncbi:hypothetical protein [Cumulibacter manganitolerans]|uniref:hypothetical protein n=1 Tax=Cumulibacter manganitolerans TaxID=1884992 RepID=UPI001295ED6A|nr:hypothetical protein [Cumulibacter manganitolerans]
MDFPARTSTAGAALTHLSAHARLSLAADRHELVAPMLDLVSELFDQLDDLDLAETPVATAFDARWE